MTHPTFGVRNTMHSINGSSMEILSTGLKPEAGDDRNGVNCERFNYQLKLVPTTPEKNT